MFIYIQIHIHINVCTYICVWGVDIFKIEYLFINTLKNIYTYLYSHLYIHI